jgi:hypothetical protein
MISTPTNILLRAADACRRRTTDPVAFSHVVFLFLLRDAGPLIVNELHSLVGGSRDTVAHAVLCLESSKLVTAPRSSNRKTPRVWSLTPSAIGFLATIDISPQPDVSAYS